MMSIDPHHPLIIDNISALLTSTIDLTNLLFKLTDYDGIQYIISGQNTDSLCFTVLAPQLASVGEAGGYESIQLNYPGFPIAIDENSYSILIDRSQLPDPSLGEERKLRANDIANKFSMFRTHFLSGPFIKALKNVKTSTAFQPKEVLIRPNEKLWVIPGENRANFIFQVNFSDHTDGSLSKVFLQEFAEARRQVPNSPVITFSLNPPEVMSMFKGATSPSTIGFLCITVLKEQIKQEEATGQWLAGFKQYLTYHLHACKTYLHMRMRKKTEGLLKVLKNAVPETLEEKTFRRVRAAKTRREESKIVYNFN